MSNPVPSDKISDGKLNFGTADVMVNSDDHTVTTRTGKVIRTFAGINADFDAAQAGQFVAASQDAAGRAETAAEVAAAAGRVYETSAAGQADSELVDGDYFWVVSAEDSEVLELWRKGASSATDTGKRTVSSEFSFETRNTLNELGDSYKFIPNDDYTVAVVDQLGFVLAGFDPDGRVIQPEDKQAVDFNQLVSEDQNIETVNLPSDEFAYAVVDQIGFVGNGWRQDGTLAFVGESDIVENIYEVYRAFVEPWGDPSEALAITWFSDSEESTDMEFRALGSGDWVGTKSSRTRAFPDSPEWIHTAFVKGLSPNTEYEFRIVGSPFVDKVKTCKLTYPFNIVHCADYQQYDFSSSGLMHKFGQQMQQKANPDLLILGGDYVNDDGRFGELYSDRWRGFLDVLWSQYRTDNGALVPLIAIMGNHEGRNAAGTSNAFAGGDGTMGQTSTLFSYSYDDNDQNRFVDSASYFTIGKRLLVVTLETDHTQPLPAQLDWFAQVLEDSVPKYDHTIIVGHTPAFSVTYPSRYVITTQGRELRNRFWAVMQNYSDKIRCYLAGHDHGLGVTYPIKTFYDEGQSLSDNDDNWSTDDGGIRQIGNGPWGGTRQTIDNARRVSNIGTEPMFEFALGYKPGEPNDIDVIGGVTNANEETWHVWFLSLTKDTLSYNAINSDGVDFVLLEDEL